MHPSDLVLLLQTLVSVVPHRQVLERVQHSQQPLEHRHRLLVCLEVLLHRQLEVCLEALLHRQLEVLLVVILEEDLVVQPQTMPLEDNLKLLEVCSAHPLKPHLEETMHLGLPLLVQEEEEQELLLSKHNHDKMDPPISICNPFQPCNNMKINLLKN